MDKSYSELQSELSQVQAILEEAQGSVFAAVDKAREAVSRLTPVASDLEAEAGELGFKNSSNYGTIQAALEKTQTAANAAMTAADQLENIKADVQLASVEAGEASANVAAAMG